MKRAAMEQIARMLTVGLAVFAANAQAFVSFDPVDWESGEVGWTLRNDVDLGDDTAAVLTDPQTGGAGAGGSDGYLKLFFGEPPVPTPVGNAMLMNFATAENFISQDVINLTFQFMGYPAAAQSVYFESSYGGSSSRWLSNPFGTSVALTWESQAVGFSDAGAWDDIDNTGISFANALTEVTSIGIDVFHGGGTSPQSFTFGLDNWQFGSESYAIPEPGTIMMALTALLGMLGFGRRQIANGFHAALHGVGEGGNARSQ